MRSRRATLTQSARFGLARQLPPGAAAEPPGVVVNDVQSQMNATRVGQIVEPASLDETAAAIADAARRQRVVCVSGGRHAMGGQQFGHDAVLLDMRRLNRVVVFDRARGLISVEAGIQWPDLIDYLHREQSGDDSPWAIRQKQSGVDRVTLGGSLASNIHGRGLQLPPIIGDVESFVLVDADGRMHTCSRRENAELFALAIGGYGLFGVIAQVTLRLAPRTKVERVVEIIAVKDLLAKVDERISQGFLDGDCQYAVDLCADAESHAGVFSCYRPTGGDGPPPDGQRSLSEDEWAQLYRLVRTDKQRAFEIYSRYYLATSGQVYWSDKHQLAGAFDAYRKAVDVRQGTEMITEVYVTRDALLPFLAQVREDFLKHEVDMSYGTIRFIEQDRESFLPWATEASVCIVCNLHVTHDAAGMHKAVQDFRRIIDRVIEHGGRFYLTYHRWAERRQVETCYPQFVEFLRLKQKYDPHERWQSDWFRHYRTMFADAI